MTKAKYDKEEIKVSCPIHLSFIKTMTDKNSEPQKLLSKKEGENNRLTYQSLLLFKSIQTRRIKSMQKELRKNLTTTLIKEKPLHWFDYMGPTVTFSSTVTAKSKLDKE